MHFSSHVLEHKLGYLKILCDNRMHFFSHFNIYLKRKSFNSVLVDIVLLKPFIAEIVNKISEVKSIKYF